MLACLSTHHRTQKLYSPTHSSQREDKKKKTKRQMFDSVLLALFLPCAGMSGIIIAYMCLFWYVSNHRRNRGLPPAKIASIKGLSPSELEMLPKVTGKELVMGTECAVCLDEIESDHPARVIPGCNHGFHLECADTWLSNNRLCPVCRAKLDPQFFSSSSQNTC